MANVDMREHFDVRKLLKFTAPSIGMTVFMSIYFVVDGFFVSNWVGSTALAAINLAYPIPLILGTAGFMMGTGGVAVVSHTRGEGDPQRANRYFSLFTYFAIVASVLLIVLGIVVLRPVLVAMGAQGELLEQAVVYGTVLVLGLPACVLQYYFQSFLPAAGKPSMGFAVTVAAGVVNIVLDAIFVVGLHGGILAVAIASVMGMATGSVIPLVYFARPNSSVLRLGRTKLEWRVIGRACFNGLSEMVANIAMSIVAIVYNVQLIRLLGEPGVAAYGVIMYVIMLFGGVFMGYCMGSAPLMAFQHGARCDAEKTSLFKKSLLLIAVFALAMFALGQLLARPIALFYVGYDAALVELTCRAFRIYALSLLLMGFNMYASSLFTSLGNGGVSAFLSFMRSLVFDCGAVLLLPMIIGADGIWFSVTIAETGSLVIAVAFVVGLRKHYGYLAPQD